MIAEAVNDFRNFTAVRVLRLFLSFISWSGNDLKNLAKVRKKNVKAGERRVLFVKMGAGNVDFCEF